MVLVTHRHATNCRHVFGSHPGADLALITELAGLDEILIFLVKIIVHRRFDSIV